ncbi:CRAL-TRIO domain-containing protein, partial [Usnea florida]
MNGTQNKNPPAGPPPPEASNTEVRLKGHIGHFTPDEESALQQFKNLCAKDGCYTPATADTKASHDDGTLVRFLRARNFKPQDAYTQFKGTEVWRKENELDALYENIDIDEYKAMRQFYPQWTGRRDKTGIPLYVYEIGKLDSKKISAYASATSKSKIKSPKLRLFALYESLTRFVMPLCTLVPGRHNAETPVDQSSNIVDLSSVGLKQLWNLRVHLQEASTLATAHYPEILDRVFIVGAPSFFPVVWGWIKKWFDPITTSKIFILAQHDVLPTLSTFIKVEDIPRKYGGELDFEYGKLPNLDPDIRK